MTATEAEKLVAEQKSSGMKVKASNDQEGTFTAIASVFGNIDAYGDVMMKGSFAKTLDEWRSKGLNIPFLWSHEIQDPMSYIGEITEARETDEGLEVTGRFDLEDERSRKAYKLMKSGRVREFSFGFFIRDAGYAEKDGEQVREVKDVDLIEVSMTQIGANRSTRLIEVRSSPDERPVVTPVEAKEDPAEAGTVELTVEQIDALVAALESAGATIEKSLTGLKAAREILTKTGEDTVETTEAVSGTADEKHATASSAETVDEEPSEAKSGDRESAVAKAARLNNLLKLSTLERMVQS